MPNWLLELLVNTALVVFIILSFSLLLVAFFGRWLARLILIARGNQQPQHRKVQNETILHELAKDEAVV